MQFFKKTTNIDFIAKQRFFMFVSLTIVVLSLVGFFVVGPKWGIDFVGGAEVQVRFTEAVGATKIRGALSDKFSGIEVVEFGASDSEYLIRLQAVSPVSKELAEKADASLKKALAEQEVLRLEITKDGNKLKLRTSKEISIPKLEELVTAAGLTVGEKLEVADAEKNEASENAEDDDDDNAKRCENSTCTWPYQGAFVYETNLKGISDMVMDDLRAQFGGDAVKRMRAEWVGAKVGDQLRTKGVSSLLYSLVFIMLYIAVRFDLRFAPGAVVALIHDIIITMGIFTLLRIEVTLATIAALLTIVGYSLNDTIVVFDRIRENIKKVRERKLVQVINGSINQTLSRTILTSVTTLLVVVVLVSVGWKTSIRDFGIALLIGVIVGTYSSIFVASPVVVWIDKLLEKKKA